MHILGISSLEHDPAAVLVGENGIIAAIEEGKLLRTRSSQGVPRNAINFCLEKARIQLNDFNIVAIGSQPHRQWGRPPTWRSLQTLTAPVSHPIYHTTTPVTLPPPLHTF